MNKIEIALRSKATWSFIGIFIVAGLEAIIPSLQGNVANLAQAILALLTIYLHPTEIKMAGTSGMLGSRYINEE